MRKVNKNNQILDELMKNLNICDIIIMKIFKKFSCKVYRLGIKDAFNLENEEMGKNEKQKNAERE